MATKNVIIGGGPAATNAIEAIRQFDVGSSITLICDEPAHSRMALPYWLAGQIPSEHTMTADDDFYKKLNVDARIGGRVEKIDPKANTLTMADGSSVSFDNLLIATGSSPLALPIEGADLPGVQPLWTLAHTQSALDATAGLDKPRVVMIGSGFIGFIMLNAMYKRGWSLGVVEREAHVLPRMLDAVSATLVQSWLGEKGIAVHCGTTAERITQSGLAKTVELADGSKLEADLVVIATGVKSNIECLAGSGIEVQEGMGGGIKVNSHMQTNFSHIYAAGDVALGPALYADGPEVHAIQPTAVDHGRIAGANMAGQNIAYGGSLSMNILDVCGLQCVSFGNWGDSSAEAMTMKNDSRHIYRSLMWHDDLMTGAIFVGQADDVGMLTDVGMVKGIMQTQTRLGPWKGFLADNPFDIRRPYVATKVAQKLVGTTLLGTASKTRQYQFKGAKPGPAVGASHASFIGTKES